MPLLTYLFVASLKAAYYFFRTVAIILMLIIIAVSIY